MAEAHTEFILHAPDEDECFADIVGPEPKARRLYGGDERNRPTGTPRGVPSDKPQQPTHDTEITAARCRPAPMVATVQNSHESLIGGLRTAPCLTGDVRNGVTPARELEDGELLEAPDMCSIDTQTNPSPYEGYAEGLAMNRRYPSVAEMERRAEEAALVVSSEPDKYPRMVLMPASKGPNPKRLTLTKCTTVLDAATRRTLSAKRRERRRCMMQARAFDYAHDALMARHAAGHLPLTKDAINFSHMRNPLTNESKHIAHARRPRNLETALRQEKAARKAAAATVSVNPEGVTEPGS